MGILNRVLFLSLAIFFIFSTLWIYINKKIDMYSYGNTFLLISLFFIAYLVIFTKNECKKLWMIVTIIIITFLSIDLFYYMLNNSLLKFCEIKEIYLKFKNISLLYFIPIFIIYFFSNKKLKLEENKESCIKKYIENTNLFPERKADAIEIINLLKNDKIHVLGIDSNWGAGKTTIINEVIECLKIEKSEIIKINILNISSDQIVPKLISELSSVLIKNNIYCGHSNKILHLISKNIESKYSLYLSKFYDATYNEELSNFLGAIELINKKIYIIFDDIDRILSEEKIRLILSFATEYSIKNIKTVIIYNQNELLYNHSKLNRDYIEKFIPRVYKITNMRFEDLLRITLEEYNDELKLEDFNYLKEVINGNKIPSEIKNEWSIIKRGRDITPRKVRNIIEEVISLKNLEIKSSKEKIELELIISFVFLKNFFYNEFYRECQFFKSLNNTFSLDEIYVEFINEPYDSGIGYKIYHANIFKALKDKKVLMKKNKENYEFSYYDRKIGEVPISKSAIAFDELIMKTEDSITPLANIKIKDGDYRIDEHYKNYYIRFDRLKIDDRESVEENNKKIKLIFSFVLRVLFKYDYIICGNDTKNPEKVDRFIEKLFENGRLL